MDVIQTLDPGHAPATDGRARLPQPTTERFQPLRLGLLNLYRFDDEWFPFADGRLLLRGNNGTGKSRVLALTLPFLFDGEVTPTRLEPDGDKAKRAEWNLLLGQHDDRLGYTWIEFGRLEDGQPTFVTLAIGMRAVKGKGLAGRWFLVTDRRIRNDPRAAADGTLSLVGDVGQPLTRDRLTAALDGHGEVFDTAKAYRAEVDRRLFGLGAHRYEALVDLLIQLRRPQLSRQMDEDALSNALSEALPPLPHAVISDVAEAFRTLDADRTALASFTAAAEATETFLDTYRRYAGVLSRRRVLEVTRANGEYERTQRELRTAERDGEEAEHRFAALTTERDRARDDERRHTEQVRALETSPTMDRVRELEHAREAASAADERAAQVRADLDQATERSTEHEARVVEARERATRSRDEVVEVAATAAETAASAGVASDHRRAVADLDLPDVRDPERIVAARAAADTAVGRRRDALEHLRGLSVEVVARAREVDAARQRREDLASHLDAARDDEREAASARDQAVVTVLADYRSWRDTLTELAAPAADELGWELEVWREQAHDRSPLAIAVDRAVTDATRRLAELRAAHRQQHAAVTGERDRTAADRAEVAAARHLPPPAPHTRDDRTRDGRAGAPLWQLVEPVDGADPERTAGFEAAMEAAGLLDAWVTPDGQVLPPGVHDAAIVTADLPPAADGGLTSVLRACIDPADPLASAVPPEVVRAVLERIGDRPGDGTVWVAEDGRYRAGAVTGAWHKETAEHLGHAAREAARRERLAALDRQIEDLDRQVATLDAEAADLEQRAATLSAEQDAAPADTPIREASLTHAAAVQRVAQQRERLAEVEAALVAATAAHDQAQAAYDDAAADVGVDETCHLDVLERSLSDHVAALAALWPRLDAHREVLHGCDRVQADLDAAQAEVERLTARVRQAHDDVLSAAARRDTLEETVGAEADEVLERLGRARADHEGATRRREELDDQLVDAKGALERARQRTEDLSTALEDHAARRADRVADLATVIDAGLVAVADPALTEVVEELPEGPLAADRGVRLARRIDQVLGEVAADDDTWSRVQRGIHGHYADLEQALLPHDLHPVVELPDGLFVVTAPFQGEARSMPDLHRLLVDEVTSRQALLTAREREVLQNHLIGDVAAHLHALLREGEDWVAEVNAELDRMPTSTGMKLRFTWQARPDLPSFPAARRHLLGHHAGWTPEQRDEIGTFLQERIAQVREADPAGTWQAHLEAALDHRGWHTFVIERQQDGQWTRLTRRSHGTGSGGEKALALTVPQFAAAAAHYRSAAAFAPRLIMLDEAFVGIDAGMRAQCLGLLQHFDLDLVMTSEREWGCYPTVPALAIAQLATHPDVDAVGVSRWVWNGRERVRAD